MPTKKKSGTTKKKSVADSIKKKLRQVGTAQGFILANKHYMYGYLKDKIAERRGITDGKKFVTPADERRDIRRKKLRKKVKKKARVKYIKSLKPRGSKISRKRSPSRKRTSKRKSR